MPDSQNRPNISDDAGQTTVEYGFMMLFGLGIVVALATALGFFPQKVVDAVLAAFA